MALKHLSGHVGNGSHLLCGTCVKDVTRLGRAKDDLRAARALLAHLTNRVHGIGTGLSVHASRLLHLLKAAIALSQSSDGRHYPVLITAGHLRNERNRPVDRTLA